MPEPTTNLEYLGEGAYVGLDHGFQLKLMANDHLYPSDTVYLEPDIYEALERYVQRLREAGLFPVSKGLSVEWAVERWNAEVRDRPAQNVHRRTLDETWRQVIRQCGGDDVALVGAGSENG